MSMSTPYLALLRGINVGGKNRLAMPALRELFVAAGCTEVQTYIQSGNVIFRADPARAASLPTEIAGRIAENCGYRVPVVLRRAQQLGAVIGANPFIAAGAAEETLHVLFLADEPSAQGIASLDPNRSIPDTFVVRGQEVYLCLPNGMGRTKLTNDYFDAKLGTVSTARNWRTITTLYALMEAMAKT